MPRILPAAPDAAAPVAPLWRALGVFRIVAWIYAAILAAHRADLFTRPLLAFAVIGVTAAWTGYTTRRFLHPPTPGRLSHRTVQNHVQNILGKLHLRNRVELARYAFDHGLDAPSEPRGTGPRPPGKSG